MNTLYRNLVVRMTLEDIKSQKEESRQELFIKFKETAKEMGVDVPTNESLSFLLGDGSIKDVIHNLRGNFRE